MKTSNNKETESLNTWLIKGLAKLLSAIAIIGLVLGFLWVIGLLDCTNKYSHKTWKEQWLNCIEKTGGDYKSC